jgi:hypothetical protein
MSVAKSVEEFNLAAQDLIWNFAPIPSDAEVICIEPDNGSFLAKRGCIIRMSNGSLFIADYNQICYPCSKLNRTCSPKAVSAQDVSARNSNVPRSSPSAASPMTNLRRAATICSLLYETIQRDKFDVPDALHHVRTAMAHLREVEAELEKRLLKDAGWAKSPSGGKRG